MFGKTTNILNDYISECYHFKYHPCRCIFLCYCFIILPDDSDGFSIQLQCVEMSLCLCLEGLQKILLILFTIN